MRTVVYVDGYNLYFGRIKHTAYKWLDLFKLFNMHVLPFKAPDSELKIIKYFTAEVKGKFSSHGHKSNQAQKAYHSALRAGVSGRIELTEGFYVAERNQAIRFTEPPDKTSRIDVWKLEEKQTDVLMALAMYRDAARGEVDHIVVCSNDNDLEPPLLQIREDFPTIKLGVVIPRRDPRTARSHPRPTSARLTRAVDWQLPHITDSALADSQFSDTVPGKRGRITKPDHW